MMDDGSKDGTWELLQELKSQDINMVIHRNEENIGIAYSYNKMVELASNEIVCMLHSDMYVPPKFDEIMLKYMKEYDFITPLRVEPNIGYPESIDKFLIDFGTRSEEFKENKFINWHEKNIEDSKGRVEQRMFFPWMIKKTLYDKVGGNDLLFLKYMVDDDDFYLRIKMSGAKYCQLFETAVYHMPSKSVRQREEGHIDIDNQYNKSIRNFVRKWGCWPSGVWDENRDMTVPPKYDIGLVVDECDLGKLHALEPWASTIYVKHNHLFNSSKELISKYISNEQPNTMILLSEKIKLYDYKKDNDIILRFSGREITENNVQEKLQFIFDIQKIIDESGEIGEMEYDIFHLNIRVMNRIESNLKVNKRRRFA
tara:strand:- start:23621 stop:24727 length:1107 start_codon:yes stop_codon:yes gene_type:complete